MFNPYHSSLLIKEELVDYITTIFPFNNAELTTSFKENLKKIISKGPYIDIKPVFETSFSIKQLIGLYIFF